MENVFISTLCVHGQARAVMYIGISCSQNSSWQLIGYRHQSIGGGNQLLNWAIDWFMAVPRQSIALRQSIGDVYARKLGLVSHIESQNIRYVISITHL